MFFLPSFSITLASTSATNPSVDVDGIFTRLSTKSMAVGKSIVSLKKFSWLSHSSTRLSEYFSDTLSPSPNYLEEYL